MKDLFRPGPFEYRMGLSKGKAEDFFKHDPEDEIVLKERKQILSEHPERHCDLLDEGRDSLEEFNELLVLWGIIPSSLPLKQLGESISPDILFMKGDTLLGGCVCFPSSWAFEDKVGKSLDWIHGAVPTLNEKFADKIAHFINKIPKDIGWLRSNWGLSGDNLLNHHPALNLPQLTESTSMNDIWFRVERQLLFSLPKTQSVLFGIRVQNYPLFEAVEDEEVKTGLLEALKTMPKEIAKYKNINRVQDSIINHLTGTTIICSNQFDRILST